MINFILICIICFLYFLLILKCLSTCIRLIKIYFMTLKINFAQNKKDDNWEQDVYKDFYTNKQNLNYNSYKENIICKLEELEISKYKDKIITLKNAKIKILKNKDADENKSIYISTISLLIVFLDKIRLISKYLQSKFDIKINFSSYDLQTIGLIIIILILTIIIMIFVNNDPIYNLRLEVINDLIKEYEDKLLQEKKLFKTYLQSKDKLSDFEINQIIDDEDVYNQKYEEFHNYLVINQDKLKKD